MKMHTTNASWLLVAVVYGTAVWLARRRGVDLPRRVALFFYLIVFVFLREALTRDVVNLPVDYLRSLPPWWFFTDDHSAHNGAMNDLVLQIVPWAHQVRESWRALEPPLWNQFSAAGYPLLANGQSSALSPLRLLALPLPLGFSFAAEAAMKLLIALTFMFLFCRRRGYGELASVAGAVAFGFSTFVVVWLHFPLATAAVFLPGVFYMIDLIVERPSFGRIVFAAVLWASVLFAGHPETTAHMFFAALLYVAWIVFVERRAAIRVVLPLGASLVVAALLAAPLLGPLVEAVRLSKRYSVLESSPRVAVHGGLPAFLELIQPRLYRGHPESMSGFASTLALGAWLFVLVTTVRRGRWRSTDFFFVLLVILTVAAVLDWPVIAPAVDSALPIAANARLRLVLCFALGVVTASALNVLARAFAFHTIASMLAIVVIIAELWGFGRNWMPNLDSRMFYPATPIIEKLQELRHSAREPFRITGTGPVLFPNTSAIYGLEDVRAHDPMTGARYIGLLRELSGYDPSNYFAPWADFNTRLLDFLNVRYIATTTDVADLGDPNRYQVVYEGRDGKVFENTSALPRVFPIRNVVLEFRDDVFIALLKKHEDWATTALLDRLPVESDTMRNDLLAPRPRDAPEATTRIVSGGSRRLRVNVSAPRYSLIATSIQWWPGWRVRTNDRALEPLKINATFVGFVVPPGRHEVEIVYSPTSFWVGVWLALATAMVLLTVGLSRRLRRDAV